LQKSIAVE